jgi:uncharacterized surface protein with fasciclin (FAS1) repeats
MRRTAIAVVSVVAALTLSACGGSTDEATTAESSSAMKGGALSSEEEVEVLEGEAAVEGIEEIPDTSGLSSNRVCPDVSPADIVACLESKDNFLYFLTGGLGYFLDGQFNDGPVTVFAPTDDAFVALGDEVLDRLREDEECLSKLITHHIKDSVYYTDDLFTGGSKFLDDVGFSAIEESSDGVITVDGAVVTSRDNVVDNGIIHVIDKVLIPNGFEECLNP